MWSGLHGYIIATNWRKKAIYHGNKWTVNVIGLDAVGLLIVEQITNLKIPTLP